MYQQIKGEMESGLQPNYSLDILGVFTLSHLVSSFSTVWGNRIMYIIPAYGCYKLGGFLLNYLSSQSASAMTPEKELDEDEKKRLEKKKKK